MQVYDLVMLVVLVGATLFGAIKGFAWQAASLASVVVSYFVAYNYRDQVAGMIKADPPWNLFLAMLLLYIGTAFVIWVGFRMISKTIDRVRLKEFDRHLGAAFGFAKGALFCLLITMFALTLLGPAQKTAICQSRSGYYIAQFLSKSHGILPKEIDQVVGPYLRKLDDQLKEGGATQMATSPDSSGATDSLEQPVMPGFQSPIPGGVWPSGGSAGSPSSGAGESNPVQPAPAWPQLPPVNWSAAASELLQPGALGGSSSGPAASSGTNPLSSPASNPAAQSAQQGAFLRPRTQ